MATREFLKNLGIEDDKIESIMAEVGKTVNKHIEKSAQLEEMNKSLNEKLSKFDGVDVEKMKSEYSKLQSKYDKDMLDKDKKFEKEKLFNSVKWSSNLAKNGAMALFDSANLTFEEGKFVGVEDFFEQLKQTDSEAFKSEQHTLSTGFEQSESGLDDDDTGVEKYFYAMNPNLKK